MLAAVGDPARARDAVTQFARMYRPHAAREDTVLFPTLHAIATKDELDALGESFEREERARFGARGFDSIVDEVAQLERAAGIADLAKFTPSGTPGSS